MVFRSFASFCHGGKEKWGAIVGTSRRNYRTGLAVSWLAAYALVLNIVLSSMLLATISPVGQSAGLEICISHPEPTGAPDNDKSTGTSIVHCPACVGNHAPGAPPTIASFAVTRIAVEIEASAASEDDNRPRLATSDHQARGPPRLT